MHKEGADAEPRCRLCPHFYSMFHHGETSPTTEHSISTVSRIMRAEGHRAESAETIFGVRCCGRDMNTHLPRAFSTSHLPASPLFLSSRPVKDEFSIQRLGSCSWAKLTRS